MEEQSTVELAGQAEAAPEGTTAKAPSEQSAAAEDQGTTTPSGPQGAAEDTFFNPNEVPDELKPAYKSMQAAFTKRMQSLSAHRQKIDAYDNFYRDPIGSIQQIAQQYGYQLSKGGQPQKKEKDATDPQTWDDVYKTASEVAYERLRKEMAPLLSEVQTMKQSAIEQQLSQIDPTWQQYEDAMMQNLKEHPTLAKDPAMLYRLSVPSEVLESRATQAALRKLEARGKSSQVSGASSTNKHPRSGLPDKPVSFTEAVEAARRKLAEEGIRPGQ